MILNNTPLKKLQRVLLLGASCLAALPAVASPNELSLENDSIALTLRIKTHQFVITDKRTKQVWKTPDLNGRFKLKSARMEDDRSIVLEFRNKRSGLHYISTVTLEQDIVGFELAARDPEAKFSEIPYPVIPTTDLSNTKLMFCNRGSGTLLPVNTPDYPNQRLVSYANTGALDIPLFGILDSNLQEGLMLLFETPTEVAVNIVPNEKGIIEPEMLWFNTFEKFGYKRKVSFHFVHKGGYVSMAERYRNWEEANLPSPTLKEKAEDRKQVNWLKGAVVVWGNIGGEIVEEGPVHGIKHMMLNGRFTDEVMQQARRQGYLLGEYDNYSDITEGELSPSKDNVDEVGLRGEDGELVLGWRTKEGKQYYNRSSQFAKRAAEATIPNLLEKYPYTARFLDVHSTLQFFENHHPDRPTDRRDDMRFRQELYGYIGSLGLVTGGEAAKAWCAPYLDYTEGNMSGSFYWFSDVGHLIRLENRSDIPREYLKFGMTPSYRVPLWELIYHDKVASTWYWGDSNGYFYNIAPEMSDVKDAMNVLYGTMPLVWLDHLGYGWNRNRDRLLETVHVTTRLHERIAFDAMTGHEFLSEDSLVQQTSFSSGAVICVNFDGVPRNIATSSGKSLMLAPNGYIVDLEGHTQSKLWKEDAAETHIQNEQFLYLKTDAASPRRIGCAVLTGELAAYAMPSGQWNIRYKSSAPVEVDLVSAGILQEGQAYRAVWINERGQYTGTIPFIEDGLLYLPSVQESTLLSVLPGLDSNIPLILPQEGQVTSDAPVSISVVNQDIEVRYTTDGTDPCLHARLYTEPFKLTSGAQIRAAAYKDGQRVSRVMASDLSVEVPLFTSPIVRGTDAPVQVDIPLGGLSELHIQVTDAKDGPHFDQAALGNARFVTKSGEKVSLTEYVPKSTIRFNIDKDRNNYEGDPISIGGVAFDEGISSHAVDHIVYKLRDDFKSFEASVGIHDRTTWKGPKGKKNGSVQFIFTGISNPTTSK